MLHRINLPLSMKYNLNVYLLYRKIFFERIFSAFYTTIVLFPFIWHYSICNQKEKQTFLNYRERWDFYFVNVIIPSMMEMNDSGQLDDVDVMEWSCSHACSGRRHEHFMKLSCTASEGCPSGLEPDPATGGGHSSEVQSNTG